MLDLHFPQQKIDYTVDSFYEQQLGIHPRRPRKHTLVGLGYYTEWIDAQGQRREIYGTITDCWEQILDSKADPMFTVRYSDNMRTYAHQISVFNLLIPETRDIPLELAWGGHLAYRTAMGIDPATVRQLSPPFHLKWVVPGTRYKEANAQDAPSLPRLVMIARGYELRFEAKTSRIKGAGLGLFVTASILPGTNIEGSCFELPPGVMIDLGTYPQSIDECKLEQTVVMKNFLYNWFTECWNFDSENQASSYIFDVTKDDEAKLTDKAEQNIILYANETDGKKTPDLVCMYDPEGVVHYLLGHKEEGKGALKLPLDSEVELKIDYGEKYEPVRVRRNYPRVTGRKREAFIKRCEQDDAESAQDMDNWNVKSVDESLRLLEENLSAESPWKQCSEDFFERVLIFAIGLRSRIKTISEEFDGVDLVKDKDEYCDCGVSSMEANDTVNRSKRVVKLACERWPTDAALKDAILSMKLLKNSVMRWFCLSEEGLEDLPGCEIRQMMLDK